MITCAKLPWIPERKVLHDVQSGETFLLRDTDRSIWMCLDPVQRVYVDLTAQHLHLETLAGWRNDRVWMVDVELTVEMRTIDAAINKEP